MGLLPAQKTAIELMREHGGKIEYIPQVGLWTPTPDTAMVDAVFFTGLTVLCLVDHGAAFWSVRKGGKFTEAKLTPSAMSGDLCRDSYDDSAIGGPRSCVLVKGHSGKHEEDGIKWS